MSGATLLDAHAAMLRDDGPIPTTVADLDDVLRRIQAYQRYAPSLPERIRFISDARSLGIPEVTAIADQLDAAWKAGLR